MDHIALLARDLDEEVAFLTGIIGLTEMPNPVGGTAIRWIEIGDGRRFHVQAGDTSRVHVERQTHFALSSPAFDALLEDFTRRGIAYCDMKGTPGAMNTRPDGMRAIFLQSPTGYWFEINDFRHP
jgi:lactoylglutathione lyase